MSARGGPVPASGRRLLVAVGALAVAAAAVPLLDEPPRLSPAAQELQRVTGGIGGGATLAPKWCFHALDPRLEDRCPTRFRPVPGLPVFCPHETGSVFRHGQ